MVARARLDWYTATAQLAILTALTTDSVTKIALAWGSRHAKYALHVTLDVLAIAGAAWAGLLAS